MIVNKNIIILSLFLSSSLFATGKELTNSLEWTGPVLIINDVLKNSYTTQLNRSNNKDREYLKQNNMIMLYDKEFSGKTNLLNVDTRTLKDKLDFENLDKKYKGINDEKVLIPTLSNNYNSRYIPINNTEDFSLNKNNAISQENGNTSLGSRCVSMGSSSCIRTKTVLPYTQTKNWGGK